MNRFGIRKYNLEEKRTVLALMILLSPTFIMHYELNALTFLYFPFEMLAIITLTKHNRWKIREWKYLIFIIAMELIVLIPTAFEKNVTYSYCCMLIAEICLVLHIINNAKNNLARVLLEFSYALRVLWVIDILSVILRIIFNTHTNSEYGFVGHKNNHAFLFVLFIGFSIMGNIIQGRKAINKRIMLSAIISLIVELIVSSTSGFVTILSLIILCFLLTRYKLRALNLINIFIGLLVLNYILIFAISQNTWIQNLLLFMGRDIGLSGRGQMWKLAIDLIKVHPFWGYGYSMPVTLWNIRTGDFVQNHCHNFFLNLALSGGIIYFVILCVYIFLVAHKIKSNGESPLMKALTYTIACFLLLGTSEIIVTVLPIFFPLFTIGFYSKYIESDYRILKT